MKRSSEEQIQFNVRLNRSTVAQLQALARLRGVSQARLVEQLAAPVINRLADALEMKQHA
jgi:hypothetical protein